MENILIGAISGNYSINDIKVWVESSKFENVKRVLLVYNKINEEIIDYLINQKIEILKPDYNFWGQQQNQFETNTGGVNFENSYHLIHNIRFFHIWNYLSLNTEYKKVFITDIKDIYFNSNPFIDLEDRKLTATSEIITYEQHDWNKNHLFINLGIIGYNLLNKQVLNVGAFGGDINLVKNICADIYLMSVGKLKVADQTSFNYLIYTKYKDITNITTDLAAHLHVVNEGLVKLDLNMLSNYKIIHQYDRIPELKRQIFNYYSL